MNQAHLHLIFNHLPIAGVITGFAVLIAGILLRNLPVKRTALFILIGSSLIAIPAFLTGEGAEELIEDLPGISHDAIEHHEEEGETFMWSILALGIVSLLALLFDLVKKLHGLVFLVPVLLLNIFCIITGYQAGSSGGEIRHPEITRNWSPGLEDTGAGHEHHDH